MHHNDHHYSLRLKQSDLLAKTAFIPLWFFFRGENEDGGKEAFMKWFSYIGELRSIYPKASVLTLSATCTKKISKRVAKVLQLSSDCIEIRISPNRPNIKLVVKKIHSETSQEKKDQLMSSLKEINSDLKLIIATSALGMGVDMVDIYTVVVYGAPSTIVELIQEIGRVGRDGKDSVALLLYNSYQLRNI